MEIDNKAILINQPFKIIMKHETALQVHGLGANISFL